MRIADLAQIGLGTLAMLDVVNRVTSVNTKKEGASLQRFLAPMSPVYYRLGGGPIEPHEKFLRETTPQALSAKVEQLLDSVYTNNWLLQNGGSRTMFGNFPSDGSLPLEVRIRETPWVSPLALVEWQNGLFGNGIYSSGFVDSKELENIQTAIASLNQQMAEEANIKVNFTMAPADRSQDPITIKQNLFFPLLDYAVRYGRPPGDDALSRADFMLRTFFESGYRPSTATWPSDKAWPPERKEDTKDLAHELQLLAEEPPLGWPGAGKRDVYLRAVEDSSPGWLARVPRIASEFNARLEFNKKKAPVGSHTVVHELSHLFSSPHPQDALNLHEDNFATAALLYALCDGRFGSSLIYDNECADLLFNLPYLIPGFKSEYSTEKPLKFGEMEMYLVRSYLNKANEPQYRKETVERFVKKMRAAVRPGRMHAQTEINRLAREMKLKKAPAHVSEQALAHIGGIVIKELVSLTGANPAIANILQTALLYSQNANSVENGLSIPFSLNARMMGHENIASVLDFLGADTLGFARLAMTRNPNVYNNLMAALETKLLMNAIVAIVAVASRAISKARGNTQQPPEEKRNAIEEVTQDLATQPDVASTLEIAEPIVPPPPHRNGPPREDEPTTSKIGTAPAVDDPIVPPSHENSSRETPAPPSPRLDEKIVIGTSPIPYYGNVTSENQRYVDSEVIEEPIDVRSTVEVRAEGICVSTGTFDPTPFEGKFERLSVSGVRAGIVGFGHKASKSFSSSSSGSKSATTASSSNNTSELEDHELTNLMSVSSGRNVQRVLKATEPGLEVSKESVVLGRRQGSGAYLLSVPVASSDLKVRLLPQAYAEGHEEHLAVGENVREAFKVGVKSKNQAKDVSHPRKK